MLFFYLTWVQWAETLIAQGNFMSSPPSLSSHMIVESYIKTLNQGRKFAVLRKRGDSDRGLIAVVFEHKNNTATAYSQSRDFITGGLSLNQVHKTPINSLDMNDWIEKQIKFDNDIWVISIDCEIEDIEETLSLFPDFS